MTNDLFRHTPAPHVPLFDAHINVLPPGVPPTNSFFRSIRVDDLETLGVHGGCVSPPAMPSYAEANDKLKLWTQSAGGKWLPFARLGGPRGSRPFTGLWQLRAAARGLFARRSPDVENLDGFAGVKLMPHVDGLPDERTFALIYDARLPVLVHAGAMCPPKWIEHNLLPRLAGPLILAHLGSWPCAAECVEDAVEMAGNDPRVFLDTSGACIARFITFAASRAPGRLLFASNTPMCTPSVQWAHVASAISDGDALRGVAFENAQRLFGDER